MEHDSEGIGNRLYKLQVFNNVETKPGYLFTYREKCNLCDREHKDNCDFAVRDDRSKLKHILQQLGNRDLILVVHWRDQPQANLDLIERPTVVEHD